MIWVAVGLIAGGVALLVLIFGSPSRGKTPDKRLPPHCPKCRAYDGWSYTFCRTCGTYKANESGVMRLMHWAWKPIDWVQRIIELDGSNLWLTERRLIDFIDGSHRLWNIWNLENPRYSSFVGIPDWNQLRLDEAIFEPLERSGAIESSSRMKGLLDDPEVNKYRVTSFKDLAVVIACLTKEEHSLGDMEYNTESDRIRQKKLAVIDTVDAMFGDAHVEASQAWSEKVKTREAWETGQHVICVQKPMRDSGGSYSPGPSTRLRSDHGEWGLEVQNLMQRYSSNPDLLVAFRLGLVNKLMRIASYHQKHCIGKVMLERGHLTGEVDPVRTEVFKAALGEKMFYEFLGILIAEEEARRRVILRNCVLMVICAPLGIGSGITISIIIRALWALL